MRTIKFRAKAVSKNDWVYGNFIHSKRFEGCSNEFRIHEQETGIESDVLEETLGQFTGLHDKNDKEIYEGDIVRLAEGVHPIRFMRGCFGFRVKSGQRYDVGTFCNVEVLGNIHDNPELLTN